MAAKSSASVSTISPGQHPRIAIGGLENTSTAIKPISILVHWGKNANTAEQKAQEVYAALHGVTGAIIGGRRMVMFQMPQPEPIGVEPTIGAFMNM